MRAWAVVLACVCVGACATGGDLLGGGDDSGTGGNDSSTSGDTGNKKEDGGDAGATCTSPNIVCPGDGGGCVDLGTNVDHCGGCTNACQTGDASALTPGSNDNPDAGVPPPDGGVEAGVPWSLGSPTCDGGTCGIDCPPGLTLCSDDICYDTTQFHEHCGNCATSCTPTEYCTDGNCCAQGTAWCGSSCISVLTDTSNCGSCGNVCPGKDTCVGGVCTACGSGNIAPTATATISGGGNTSPYLPSDVNSGNTEAMDCNEFAWITAGNTPGTAWIQYTWKSAVQMTSMHLGTTSATVTDACGNLGRTLGAAEIQWWNGASWVTDGSVSGQLGSWSYTFTTTITTTQVRLYAVYCTNTMGQESNPQVYDWEVYGCN